MSTISSTDAVLDTQFFWYRHRKEIVVLFILLLLGGAAWGGYRFYVEHREGTAATALAAAKTASDFQKVIAQFPGTPACASAYLFLADEQKKEKKFAEANVTLQSFLDKYPQHIMKGTARLTMATNLEALGKTDEALALYQRLATEEPDSYVAPTALLAQVPILKAKQQDDLARQACETVMTKYRDRFFTGEAQAKLRFLKPPTPTQPPAPPPQALSPEAIVKNLVPSLKMRPPPPTQSQPSATAAASSPAAANSPAAATSPAADTSPAAATSTNAETSSEATAAEHPSKKSSRRKKR